MSGSDMPPESSANLEDSGSDRDEIPSVDQSGLSHVKLSIPMASEEDAKVIWNTLRIDREPPRSHVVKTLSHEGSNLIAIFESADVKSLRTAVNSFFSSVLLRLMEKTINFSPLILALNDDKDDIQILEVIEKGPAESGEKNRAKEGGNGMRASSPKNRLKRKRSGPILESTKVFSPRPDHKINYSVARPNLNRLPKQIINEDLRKLAEFLVENQPDKPVNISWFGSNPLENLFYSSPEIVPEAKPNPVPKFLPFEFCANFEAESEEGESFLLSGLKNLRTMILRENALPTQELTRSLIHKVMMKSTKKQVSSECLNVLRLMISRFDCDATSMRQWWIECLVPQGIGERKKKKKYELIPPSIQEFSAGISVMLENLIKKIYKNPDPSDPATMGEFCFVELIVSLMSEDLYLHLLRCTSFAALISPMFNLQPLVIRIFWPTGSHGKFSAIQSRFLEPICNNLSYADSPVKSLSQKLIGLVAESIRLVEMSSRKTAIFKLIPSQEHPFEATSMTDLASCCTPGLTRFVRDFCDCLMSGNEEKPEICGSLIASLPIKWLSFTGLIYMSVKYPEDKQTRDTFYYKCCVSKVDPSCFFESLKSNGIIPG